MTSPLDARILAALADLRDAGLARACPEVTDRQGIRYRVAGQPVLGFCSNDYLGLAEHPVLAVSTSSASGSSASRLVCGDLPDHRAAEAEIARWLGYDDAILFPSGFQLNVGVLPSLVHPTDVVYSDALNHASLIDGMRLASSRPRILPHRAAPPPGPADAIHWWVSESIFSMDGDAIDTNALREHLSTGGHAYVDEAHALGLFGSGYGLMGHMSIRPHLLVGTLGKALGCAGAFVVASQPVCTWIRTRCRSFVFSTGIAPPLVDRIVAAVRAVQSPLGDERRRALWRNVDRLANALGLDASGVRSPIFPIVVGSNTAALDVAARLLRDGIHVQPIRPPTVPDGTARLRLTVSALHDDDDLDHLLAALRRQLPLLHRP